jgi:hypothetical protein
LTRVSIDLRNKCFQEKMDGPGLTGRFSRTRWSSFAGNSGLSLHVDLEAEVDFGSRRSAANAPIFRRGLDERDLDIGWRNIERREIADDGLVKRSLGDHRSAGKPS